MPGVGGASSGCRLPLRWRRERRRERLAEQLGGPIYDITTAEEETQGSRGAGMAAQRIGRHHPRLDRIRTTLLPASVGIHASIW
jgi:hypothetical protein